MQQRSFPRGVWAALLWIVISFVGLIAVEIYQGLAPIEKLAQDRQRITHVSQVIATAQALKTALQDAERGERGYLLTGEGAYLEPYRSGAAAVPALLSKLEQLTVSSSEQRRHLPLLAQQIDMKRKDMQLGLDAYLHEGLDGARKVLRTNAGLDAMTAVDSIINAVMATENEMLTARLASEADDGRAMGQFALAAGGLSFLALATGLGLTLYAFKEARRLEACRLSEERRLSQELAHSQAALAQAQKMEALGQLTGGIAHDFNNVLHVIRNALDVLDRRLPSAEPDLRRCVEMVRRNADRAASTTARLLAFARRQPLDPRPLDANQLVVSMTDLLRYTVGDGIGTECVLSRDLWLAMADSNQLEMAILNLAVNARDAMAGSGKLIIETSNVVLDRAYAQMHPDVVAGQYVMISASDNGVGMTREVMARACEPFFTTKEAGQGTGLGLSQVFGFIKQSGGHIKLSSELGSGTTVRLYLPRSESTIPSSEPPDRSEEGAIRRETLLLLEENDELRTFTACVLGELRYHLVARLPGQLSPAG